MSGYPTTVYGNPPLPPLMTDAELKTLLGITVADNDAAIAFANQVCSQLIRDSTGRMLTRGDYRDTFISNSGYQVFLSLGEFPLNSVVKVEKDGVEIGYGVEHAAMGQIFLQNNYPNTKIDVYYNANADPLPFDLQAVLLELVRRQLSTMGIDPGAGSASAAPVKSVTVGALRVDYAVTGAGAAASGVSPVLKSVLDQYESTLVMYRHPRMFAATP